jgi:hypothetical protein
MPVSFARSAASPALPPGQPAIRVALSPPGGGAGALLVYGACQLPLDLADALVGSPLESVALVCCAGPGRGVLSRPLVRQQVVFPDDVHVTGGWATAWFSLDLAEEGLPRALGRCYLHASLHTLVSNVIAFDRS